MPISERELAFFGGWRQRTLTGGTHRWGDPRWRNQEVTPSLPSTLVLPDDTEWLQGGVDFRVLNSGTAAITVIAPGDDPLSQSVAAGASARFVKCGKWIGWLHGTPQYGSVTPALVYEIEVSANASRINILDRVISQHGYDGSQPAAVICRVLTGVAVGASANSHRAITTGDTIGGVSWASGSIVRLIVAGGAIVGGWGGNGGSAGLAGTGSPSGFDGQDGGQAIRAEIPLRIDCDGYIFGGGGGGGGGGSSPSNTSINGGGGGGARGANMAAGSGVLIGSLGGPGRNGGSAGGTPGFDGSGLTGSTFTPGAGGPGINGGGDGGAGGAGGDGSPGLAASPGGSGGAGGLGAAAISYLPSAGAPVILSGGGNIIGSTVAEAS